VARTPGSGSDALDIEGAMGGPDGGDRAERAEPEPAPTGTPGSDPTPATGSGEANPARDPSGPGAAGATARRPAGDAADAAPDGEGSDPESVERTTVRVTADVGNIYGVDGRSYDLSAEDVVTLPARNAENLVSKHAAERLD
jgi:DNA replication factor GINS